ncbi:hypothetical protein Nepgr_015068 [Nepenthes gracilis]|uniref:Uncharacterized protein n=1 Tax=Nepenthes gracilis TaxID=150966 RepID=A0AAD3XQ37_NEPGR|nr:hypothetical protein Nepgr_015068 [Nepenthes gracilis]
MGIGFVEGKQSTKLCSWQLKGFMFCNGDKMRRGIWSACEYSNGSLPPPASKPDAPSHWSITDPAHNPVHASCACSVHHLRWHWAYGQSVPVSGLPFVTAAQASRYDLCQNCHRRPSPRWTTSVYAGWGSYVPADYATRGITHGLIVFGHRHRHRRMARSHSAPCQTNKCSAGWQSLCLCRDLLHAMSCSDRDPTMNDTPACLALPWLAPCRTTVSGVTDNTDATCQSAAAGCHIRHRSNVGRPHHSCHI